MKPSVERVQTIGYCMRFHVACTSVCVDFPGENATIKTEAAGKLVVTNPSLCDALEQVCSVVGIRNNAQASAKTL